jgi:hypothetical protein
MFSAWLEALMSRVAGSDEKSLKRRVLLWIIPALGILLLLSLATWLGIKLDAETAQKLPSWVVLAVPYSPYIFVLAALFVAWHAAIAYETVKGPRVWMGKIEVDKGYRFYEFPIKFRGSGKVVAYARATELRNERGERLPVINPDGIELHFRGYYVHQKVKLFGDKHAIVAFMQVNTGDAGTAHWLLVVPAAEPNFAVVPLVSASPTPLKNQQKMYLTIRVDLFREAEGYEAEQFLATKTRQIVISPKAKESLCYRVRSVSS